LGTVPVTWSSPDLIAQFNGHYRKVNDVNKWPAQARGKAMWAFTTKEYQVIDDFEPTRTSRQTGLPDVDRWSASADEFIRKAVPATAPRPRSAMTRWPGTSDKTIFHGAHNIP
jgi:hypothetical protein